MFRNKKSGGGGENEGNRDHCWAKHGHDWKWGVMGLGAGGPGHFKLLLAFGLKRVTLRDQGCRSSAI